MYFGRIDVRISWSFITPKIFEISGLLHQSRSDTGRNWNQIEKVFPTVKVDLIPDLNDNKILELADECEADFIITGNTNDFTFSSYKGTKIVLPKHIGIIINQINKKKWSTEGYPK